MSSRLVRFKDSVLLVPRITTLNVNNLSYYNTTKQGRARHCHILETLRTLSTTNDIVCLQETGLARNEKLALSNSLPRCKVTLSSAEHNVAGVAVVDCPSLLETYSVNNLLLPSTLNGYVLGRSYHPKNPDSGYTAFQIINSYFYTGEDKEARQSTICESLLKVDNSLPTFLCGDFNFVTEALDSTSASRPSNPFLSLFNKVLAHFGLVEAPSEDHTFFRFSSAGNHSARLDRFYIPSPLLSSPLVSPVVSTTLHHVLYSPSNSRRISFTDHLPLSLSFFSVSSSHSVTNNRIPQWVAEAPEFATKVAELVESTPTSRSPFRALSNLKGIFRRAAHFVKQNNFSRATLLQTLSSQILCLKLISVPRQSRSSIGQLLSQSPSLKEFVSFSQGRWKEVGLSDAISVTLASLSPQSTHHHRPNPLHIKNVLPHTRSHLGGLREETNEETRTSPEEMAKIAAKFWGKVWTPRTPPSSNQERKVWLQWYDKKIQPDLLTIPSLDTVKTALLSPKNTSPGPDGIPFACWRAVPDISGPLLYNALSALMRGDLPPKGFNSGLLFLLPKKNTHLVSDTRPLSVTNTDNRILARIIANSIMPAVKALVNPAQKGFLEGIQGTDHIVDINSIFYSHVCRKKDSYLFFLDTAKAFDSIDHVWIHDILVKTKFPSWVLNFFKAAVSDVSVTPFFGSPSNIHIDIGRGVKQGCPLSPLLFLLAYDPLIEDLANTSFLRVFAFADDLAISFHRLPDIDYPLRRIDSFSEISGLGRNPAKSCVISARHRETDPRAINFLLNCRWPDLKLVRDTTYLGLPIGASVTLLDVFGPPVRKMFDRLRLLSPILTTLPLHKKILLVNTYVVSLFSYVSLFFVLPSDLWGEVKEAIRLAVTPFHGGGYPYEALVCGGLLFNLKPALRDVWAAGVSLLSVRSTYFPQVRKPDPPFVDLRYNMSIVAHRDSAAYDVWCLQDRPTCPPCSPKVYKCVIKGYFLPLAQEKWMVKLSKHVSSPSLSEISSNCLSIRSLPPYLSAFFLSLLSNALPTSRRLRHFQGRSVAQVDPCHYCNKYEDSISHLFSSCDIVSSAARSLFSLCCLPLSFTPLSLSSIFLSVSFPHDLRPRISATIISFAFAVWSFRNKALSTREELGPSWICNRLVSLAHNVSLSFLQGKKSSKGKALEAEKVVAHIGSLDPLSISCFTDGSAAPNPGPCGSGAFIRIPSLDGSPGSFVDLGAPLGQGTNNLGEVWAIGISLFYLLSLPDIHMYHEICIFSDSQYAMSVTQGTGKIAAHKKILSLVRSTLSQLSCLIKVRFVWVPGHAGIFGNERADKISGLFSRASNDVTLPTPFSSSPLSLGSALFHSISLSHNPPTIPFPTSHSSPLSVDSLAAFTFRSLNRSPSAVLLHSSLTGSLSSDTHRTHLSRSAPPVSECELLSSDAALRSCQNTLDKPVLTTFIATDTSPLLPQSSQFPLPSSVEEEELSCPVAPVALQGFHPPWMTRLARGGMLVIPSINPEGYSGSTGRSSLYALPSFSSSNHPLPVPGNISAAGAFLGDVHDNLDTLSSHAFRDHSTFGYDNCFNSGLTKTDLVSYSFDASSGLTLALPSGPLEDHGLATDSAFCAQVHFDCLPDSFRPVGGNGHSPYPIFHARDLPNLNRFSDSFHPLGNGLSPFRAPPSARVGPLDTVFVWGSETFVPDPG